jgi:hypothetical protein
MGGTIASQEKRGRRTRFSLLSSLEHHLRFYRLAASLLALAERNSFQLFFSCQTGDLHGDSTPRRSLFVSGGRNAERRMIALRVRDPAARQEEAPSGNDFDLSTIGPGTRGRAASASNHHKINQRESWKLRRREARTEDTEVTEGLSSCEADAKRRCRGVGRCGHATRLEE